MEKLLSPKHAEANLSHPPLHAALRIVPKTASDDGRCRGNHDSKSAGEPTFAFVVDDLISPVSVRPPEHRI